MLTIVLPPFTAVVITIAALLYISDRFGTIIARDRNHRLDSVIRKLEKIHEDAAKEIDDMSFDLYWSDIVDNIKRRLKERVVVPDELRNALPSELLEGLLEPQVLEIRGISRHLAIHARMGNKDRAYIDRLPKSLRQKLTDAFEDHNEDLERQRTMLVGAGVDIDALEAHFSSK